MADVEALLVPWLAAQVAARTVTELPADLDTIAPAVHVLRIGGPSDDDLPAFDMPTVSVDSYGIGRSAALTLAQAVDDAIRVVLPNTLHTLGGLSAVVTKTQTITGPSWRPYDDITLRRFGATYRLHVRTR
jgi:hypothetical protein